MSKQSERGSSKTNQDSADAKPQRRRRLKAAGPTVRERTTKAQAAAAAPAKTSRSKQVLKSAVKPLAPVGAFLYKVFNRQPFKFLAKILRFIGRIVFPRSLRNAFKELKWVTWPSRQETRALTFAVLLFALIFGVVVASVDYGLDKLFKAFIVK